MTSKNFAEGVAIIAKYIPEDKSGDVCASHDQLWFGDEDWITDPDDIKRLEELGWMIDYENGGWMCFP